MVSTLVTSCATVWAWSNTITTTTTTTAAAAAAGGVVVAWLVL